MTPLKQLADEVRYEANIAARPGQLERLAAVADRLDALASAESDRVEYMLNVCRAQGGSRSNAQIVAETEYVFAAPQRPTVSREAFYSACGQFALNFREYRVEPAMIEALRALNIEVTP